MKTTLPSRLEVTEGTPDLGITSYWTDAEGNVVFGPNTPEEKMKTTVTGSKKQTRKDSAAKTPLVEKMGDKDESKSKESEGQKDEGKVDEGEAGGVDLQQTEDVEEDVLEPEAPEQGNENVDEHQVEEETQSKET